MPKEIIHDTHESGWSISKSKWHDHPFEQPLLGIEGGLPHIRLCNSNVVITTTQIQFGEIDRIL